MKYQEYINEKNRVIMLCVIGAGAGLILSTSITTLMGLDREWNNLFAIVIFGISAVIYYKVRIVNKDLDALAPKVDTIDTWFRNLGVEKKQEIYEKFVKD